MIYPAFPEVHLPFLSSPGATAQNFLVLESLEPLVQPSTQVC